MFCVRARLQSGRKDPTKIWALAPGLFFASWLKTPCTVENYPWTSISCGIKQTRKGNVGPSPLLRRQQFQGFVRGSFAGARWGWPSRPDAPEFVVGGEAYR